MGDAALYAERDDVATWERLVRELFRDEERWAERSRLSRERAAFWDSCDELDGLIQSIAEIASRSIREHRDHHGQG
jgi:hypothetical protein